jgi:integrase
VVGVTGFEPLEKLYVRMMKSGSAPATAHQAHRTIRTALNEAVRRGHLARNPAALAKAPRLPEAEVEPYSVDEIRLLLQSALEGRNGPGGPSRSRSDFGRAKRSGSDGTT